MLSKKSSQTLFFLIQARDQVATETQNYKDAHRRLVATGITGRTLEREEDKATRALTNIMTIQAKCTRRSGRAARGDCQARTNTGSSLPDESAEERQARIDQFASSIRVNEELLKGLEAKSQGRNVKLVGEGLTIYDGKTVVEFGAWIDLFTSMVHVNPRYSTIEKFGIMTAHLSGNARKLLAGMSRTADNYQTAYDILNARLRKP